MNRIFPLHCRGLLAALLMLLALPLQAQLVIDIRGGDANQIPIAVLQFAGESQLPQSMTCHRGRSGAQRPLSYALRWRSEQPA
jgi:hypothetical protein